MKNFIGSRALPKLYYHSPKEINSALALLKDSKNEWRIVAGCTDFIPAIRRGAWHFGDGLNVIDVKGIDELKGITKEGETIKIGAATRLSDIVNSDILRKHAPILCDAVNEMASLQIRNLGTLGGNLCTASPAADTAPPLLVLNATVNVKGINGGEAIPLVDFFKGPGQSALTGKNILTEISFPAMKGDDKACRIKLGRRMAATLSVVSVAVWARVKNSIFEEVRIALGATAPTPMRARNAEAYLAGKEASDQVIDEGARIASGEVKPITDVRATSEYRRDMVQVLTCRALKNAISR